MRFPQAMDITQMSLNGTAADNVLRAAILVAVYTAVQTNGKITSSVATTSVDEDALQGVIGELNKQGYTVAYPDATHITVAWS
jgi:hypothetical protein